MKRPAQEDEMSTFSEVQNQAQDRAIDAVKRTEDIPSSIYFGAVIGSIVLSAILFMTGRRNIGIFVGLWPPTILNMALFAKQLHPSQDVERGMGNMQEKMHGSA
jgi:hypothetical protein